MRPFPRLEDRERPRRGVPDFLTHASARVPLEQRTERGVGLEVLVLQRLGCVDAASVEARPDQEHRLVVIAHHAAAVSTLPRACDRERRYELEDLLLFAAPTARLKLLGGDPCPAQ